MRVRAEAVRETIHRKQESFTEEEAARLYGAELARTSDGVAKSNDIFRRPRITRKAAREFYLRGYAAGVLAALGIEIDPEPGEDD